MPYLEGGLMRGIRRGRVLVLGLLLLCLLLPVLYPDDTGARVKGKCRDCHDMHAPSSKPFPALTKSDCIGCHAMDPEGQESIIIWGHAKVPQVLHNMQDGDLAAGNFIYVADGFKADYSKGHNVEGISAKEQFMSPMRRHGEILKEELPPRTTPPGFVGSAPIPGGYGPERWPDEKQLACAGTWGCHGDRNIEDQFKAIAGAHHEKDDKLDGTTVGKSYRYLLGVVGVEHPDWEYQATIGNHNGYKGDITHSATDTFSYFCGQCHVTYHPHPFLGGEVEVGSVLGNPWHRHPTDIALGTVRIGFSGSEYQNYITYSLEAPVGFRDPKGNEKTVDQDSIVVCSSCHRAHASPYEDILRWNYDTMVAGVQRTVNTGCFTCHTMK